MIKANKTRINKFIILSTVLFLVLINHSGIKAQIYYEGQYTFGGTSIEKITPEYDSSIFNMLKENIKFARQTVAYTKNKIAFVFYNEFGDTTVRMVEDFKLNKIFYFNYYSGIPHYKIDTLNISKMDLSNSMPLKNRLKIISVSDSLFNIKGLKCRKVIMEDEKMGLMESYYTDQIITPLISYLPRKKQLGIMDSTTMIRQSFNIFGFRIIADIDSFIPEVKNIELLSTSTRGIEPEVDLGSYIRDLFTDNSEKTEKGDSINFDIAEKMNELNLYPDYKLKILEEEKSNIDKYSLILKSITEGVNLSSDTLISIWYRNGLISKIQENEIINEFQHIKNKTNFKLFIKLFLIKDMLNEEEIRKNIVNNIKKLGYKFDPNTQKEVKDFIDGKSMLPDFLFTLEIIHPVLKNNITLNADSLVKNIETFLNQVFPEIKERINVKRNITDSQKEFIINIKEELYKISEEDFHSPETIDIDEIDTLNKNSNLEEIELNFYQVLSPIIKQIACDNGIKNSYSIGYIHNHIGNLAESNYLSFIKDNPNLKLFKPSIYLLKFPVTDYKPFGGDIPVSFQIKEGHSNNEELVISSFYKGDDDSDWEFVTSKEKRIFIEYIKNNKKELGLDDEKLSTTINKIQNQLYGDLFALIKEAFNKNQTINMVNSSIPPIDPLKNSFYDVFPQLKTMLGDDFNATNLREDKNNKFRILMDVNGETISVANEWGRGIKTVFFEVHKYLAKEKKGIFTYPTFIAVNRTFFLLSYKQKKELQELLGIRFLPVTRFE